MTNLSLAYDMRAPEFGTSPTRLYPAALEQAAWADRVGFTDVRLMEHHASTDGYLPSPIVFGASIAGATDRVLIRLSLLILPLYEPLRLAEDLAVLDLTSEGRMRLTVGLGYREEEYLQFGVSIKRRPSLVEEAIDTLKQAWTGDPFLFRDRTVRILPRPAQRPRPLIMMGGASPASARRAARIADGYQPVADRLYEIYLDELRRLGRPEVPSLRRPKSDGTFVFVADDPDQYWNRIARYVLYDSNEYANWIGDRRGTYRPVTTLEEVQALGTYQVVTPEECIQIAERQGGLTFKPLIGGMPPNIGWESLELFNAKVLPRLRHAAA